MIEDRINSGERIRGETFVLYFPLLLSGKVDVRDCKFYVHPHAPEVASWIVLVPSAYGEFEDNELVKCREV